MKGFLKSTWERMNTNQRSWVIVVSAIVIMVFITIITGGSWLGLNDTDSKAKPKHKTTAVAKKNEEVKKETKKVAEKPVKKVYPTNMNFKKYMTEQFPDIMQFNYDPSINQSVNIQYSINSTDEKEISTALYNMVKAIMRHDNYKKIDVIDIFTGDGGKKNFSKTVSLTFLPKTLNKQPLTAKYKTEMFSLATGLWTRNDLTMDSKYSMQVVQYVNGTKSLISMVQNDCGEIAKAMRNNNFKDLKIYSKLLTQDAKQLSGGITPNRYKDFQSKLNKALKIYIKAGEGIPKLANNENAKIGVSTKDLAKASKILLECKEFIERK